MKLLILALVLFNVVAQGLAQQVPLHVNKIITPGLSQFIDKLRAEANIPGLTLGVVHSNGQVEHGAWGIKDENGANATTDTSFILASCSKAFLSAAMGILMDDFARGKNVTALPADVNVFDWSTKVVDLLPGQWQLEDEWATKKANIRDILSHVSGVPRHDYSPSRTDAPIDVLLNLRNLRPAYELREQWSYNNLMYISASHLISVYSGMRYVDFVKERIFTPLGMSSTTFSPTEAAQDDGLTQAWAYNKRRIPTWFTDGTMDLNAGPGGIISNAVDMTKWVKILLNEGVDPDTNTTVIPMSAFEAVTTPHAIMEGRPSTPDASIVGYGMGWGRGSYKGHELISHTGGIPGISTRIEFLPADGLGYVVLTNTDAGQPGIIKLVQHIMDETLGLGSAWDTTSSHERDTQPTSSHTAHPSQEIAEPSLPIAAYAGTYENAGYGTITLCAPSSTSPGCLRVLNTFAAIHNVTASENRHTLYAEYGTMWSSHIRLRYAGGNDFYMSLPELFPHGYGKDTTPFEVNSLGEDSGEAVAKFVVNKEGSRVLAFGFMGAEEEQEGRKRLLRNAGVEYSIPAAAEVILTRVDSE
ncbi:hypothetical protein EIP91_006403 [Steccherinum ochraceum]|uniref:Beta-lactamase-related domain-containing protein n=1 Tax=Steccherinum ochraceum TaxID=92696 RepID=A0A4R0RBK3_9APHY|nr:hypothetical protein EIP91_006403 [Steccherinum ochraceum]